MEELIKKSSIICFSILLITSLIFSCIISQNAKHLDSCRDENCEMCNLIHIAQDFLRKACGLAICIKIYYSFITLSEKLVIKKYLLIMPFLFQNTQLNE